MFKIGEYFKGNDFLRVADAEKMGISRAVLSQMANSLLISRSLCPLSFRTVEANDYRAALLLFYEQNNISAFKKMFLEQIEFAMKEYF